MCAHSNTVLADALRHLAGCGNVALDRLECSNAKADILAGLALRKALEDTYALIGKNLPFKGETT